MQVKHGMVCATNTVIDPRAMMVISVYTLVTDVAMSALGQSNHFTEGAEALSIKCF
jgi:hypothetical protein